MEYETLWTFDTARFTVALEATYEPCPDNSWMDEETLEQVNNGYLASYVFRVRVIFDGETIGEDYLGDSVYSNPRDFCKVGSRDYFPDMVREAVREARKHLANVPKMRVA